MVLFNPDSASELDVGPEAQRSVFLDTISEGEVNRIRVDPQSNDWGPCQKRTRHPQKYPQKTATQDTGRHQWERSRDQPNMPWMAGNHQKGEEARREPPLEPAGRLAMPTP